MSPVRNMPKPPSLVTIGAYGWSASAFFGALERARVEQLLDLRRRRAVRGSELAWANSSRLQRELAARGIAYAHRLDLAPTQAMLRAQHAVDKAAGIRFRDREQLSKAYLKAFEQQILARLDASELVASLGAAKVVALFCVEGRPQACHRSLVARRMHEELGCPVKHLQPPAS
jgi:uncharacterized protein (DUF488 family)